MVGPALPRVTSSDGLAQEEHHGEKSRWHGGPTRGTPHYHARQEHAKSYTRGGDPGKRNVQRSTKGADHRVGGTPDVTGRVNLPSSTVSSGHSYSQSNLDRFLDETTPRVRTHTFPKSSLRDFSQKRCCNPEVAPYFNLGDLWDSFDEWSAYGAGVHLTLNGDESVVQYYVPYLSAIQLYTVPSRRPDWPAGFRHRGSDSDTASDASSSDGESEKSFRGYKGAESPPPNLGGSLGNGSMLECKTYMNDNDEEVEVWSYFEKSPPYTRLPLVDKIADLSRDFKHGQNPLRTLRSLDLLPNSWLSVAWYPIYRIPTGPTLRDLAACFLTFYPLSTSLQPGDGTLRQSGLSNVCIMPTSCSLDPQPLRAFGLASYKLKGAVWSSTPEKRLATSLQHNADEHLKHLRVEHPDYNYFTSHTIPTRC
ncbi:hypothetical protein M758_6G177300 [Ceratodon purpureus]|uniref:Uncharacterized protein n=1 Tax=Ceratodon purpureus TaxID=3225 RepID=A0A8T0HIC6_CERPU|nr:hypothetical protein KC19_6G184300 [Ceratodon purpureus]KAG0614439.1 hypothetical protein M758_6G177300 [Ceratodon purpureus]